MKKTTRATYAAVAGLALLTASGGSTYALWQDTAALGTEGSIIQTGDLRLDFDNLEYDRYHQVSWTLTPGANSTSPALKDVRNLGNVLVGPGDVLVGTTTIRTTLEGDTLVANLLEPDWNYTQEGSAALVAWLNQFQTTVEITHANKGAITGTNHTGAPVNLNASETYTVTITIKFATTNYPTSATERQTAARHMGNINLELRQQTSGNYFRIGVEG